MSSILKVSEIQDPTNGNTALKVASDGAVQMTTVEHTNGTGAMTIQSDGVISRGKIPHLKVGSSGSISMGGANDYIRYNSFDASQVFGGEDNMSAYSTSDARYTIPTGCSGLWHISAALYATSSNVNQLAINVNGTREDAIGSDAGSTNMNQGAIVKRLEAGDLIRIYAFYSANITTQGNKYHTWWEMTFLG